MMIKLGEKVPQDRQIVAETDGAGSRDVQRGGVLRRRRNTVAAAAAPPGRTGTLSEVLIGIFGEETAQLPALFLRLRSRPARDPGPGVRFAHHSESPALHFR